MLQIRGGARRTVLDIEVQKNNGVLEDPIFGRVSDAVSVQPFTLRIPRLNTL